MVSFTIITKKRGLKNIIQKIKLFFVFAASSEGSVSLEEGEELWLIETDQGDGWTRVRRLNPTSVDPMPEGFVPTSYLEIYDMFAQPQPV